MLVYSSPRFIRPHSLNLNQLMTNPNKMSSQSIKEVVTNLVITTEETRDLGEVVEVEAVTEVG